MNSPASTTPKLLEENKQLRSSLAELQLATEQHAAELQAREERFALAMRGFTDGLWDWNLETNEIYLSAGLKSILGYKEDELADVIDTWESLMHPGDKDMVKDAINAHLKGKTNAFEFECRMLHKDGHVVFILGRGFSEYSEPNKPIRLMGAHIDISERKKAEIFNIRTASILEMIARGNPAPEIYDAIAVMYEQRNPGMRCSMLELNDGKLLHGGAPSMPKAYCEAVHGLQNGPDVGSCGTSTYTGKRCIVENIETDPKWTDIKGAALPHGMRCCWSEPIKNSRNEVLGAFGMYYDFPALPNAEESEDLTSAARLAGIVMERDQDQKRIRQLAYTDVLTGLASRAHFYLHLEDLIKSSQRHRRTFSLLYIDLDNFKHVNDSLGHEAGDLLLKEIALRLHQTGRETDFITRIAGDEFSIIMEDTEDSLAAGKFCQRCLDSIAKPLQLTGRHLAPSCSIGIAQYPHDGTTISSLLKAADTALYAAKKQGKNCYAFYESSLTEKAEYRLKFEQYLRQAIETEQIELVYQPQVDSASGCITGVEALCRWHHADLGSVSADELTATAEKIGMIKPLTDWVLHTACKQAVQWQENTGRSLHMAVNISPGLFLNSDLVQSVKRAIDETGMRASTLELEVTERVVKAGQHNLSTFQALKKIGVSLVIGDFGSGYSSYTSLRHLGIDCLKIDQYFIDDIASEDTRILVASMTQIGHKFCHKVIAEGVQDSEQFKIARELGCESVQGILFSEPVSAKQLVKLLDQQYPV